MSNNSVFILKLCWGDTKYGQPHTIMYYDSLDKITWLFDRYWDNEVMWIEVVPTKKTLIYMNWLLKIRQNNYKHTHWVCL